MSQLLFAETSQRFELKLSEKAAEVKMKIIHDDENFC